MTTPSAPAAVLPAPPWREPRRFGRLWVSIHVVQPKLPSGPEASTLPGTSRGFTLARPSLLVAVRRGETLALGEASPLPGFGADGTLPEALTHLASFDWSRLDRTDTPSLDEFAHLTLGVASTSARHAIEGIALGLFAASRSEAPDALLVALAGSAFARTRPNTVRTSTVLDPLAADYGAELERVLDRGYRAFKLKCGRDVDAEIRAIATAVRVLSSRKISASIRLDANLALDESGARRLVDGAIAAGFLPRSLAEPTTRLTLDWIEDPTPRPEEWFTLAARCLVAADEVLLDPATTERAFASGARVFIAKPMMLGGMVPVLSLAHRAREMGGVVSLSHAFDGPVALALASRLAALLQPSGIAAGLGMHAGLAGWQAPLADPPLPVDLAWPEAPALSPLRRSSAQPGLPTPPDDVLVHRGPALALGLDTLLSPSQAARDATTQLAVVGDGFALDYQTLAERLTHLAPASRFAPLPVGADLPSVLAVLAQLEHRAPAFLQHPSWSASLTRDLTERVATEVPEPNEAFVLATSGTSGPPRLVVHSRASLLAAVTASAQHLGFPAQGDRWLLNLPLAHVGGLSIVLRCLAARQTLVLGDPKEDPTALLERVQRLGVTLISAVPTQLSRWLADPGFSAPRSLRAVLVGGAPLSSSLRREAERRGLSVVATYGMTETASQLATESSGSKISESGSASSGLRLLPGIEARVEVDAGRLLVRGPQLFGRLLGEAGALTPDGYYRTSDRAHFDEDGALIVDGRLDSVIVTGGEKVSPESLELRLRDAFEGSAPSVEANAAQSRVFPGELCVVGVPDAEWGERVVLLAEGAFSHQEATSVIARLGSAIERTCARYERPKDVRLVRELPRLPSGKLDRSAARELAELLARGPESANPESA